MRKPNRRQGNLKTMQHFGTDTRENKSLDIEILSCIVTGGPVPKVLGGGKECHWI